MKRIRRSHTTCLFGPDQAPVAEMEPSEAVLFETEDAQAGRVKTQVDALSVILPESEANPVTGPVWVRDARPGDTLAVHLLEIRLVSRGLGRVRPGRGALGAEVAGAIRLASGDMARLLAGQLDLSLEDSFILIGAAGDVRIGQAAEVGVDMTAYLSISKSIMPAAF